MTKEDILDLYSKEKLSDWLNRLPERLDELILTVKNK